MIVNDFDIVRIADRPAKTHAPLIVDPNTVPAETVAVQFLQSISWRKPQFIETTGGVNLHELPEHDASEIRREVADWFATPEALGVSVSKASDHPIA